MSSWGNSRTRLWRSRPGARPLASPGSAPSGRSRRNTARRRPSDPGVVHGPRRTAAGAAAHGRRRGGGSDGPPCAGVAGALDCCRARADRHALMGFDPAMRNTAEASKTRQRAGGEVASGRTPRSGWTADQASPGRLEESEDRLLGEVRGGSAARNAACRSSRALKGEPTALQALGCDDVEDHRDLLAILSDGNVVAHQLDVCGGQSAW